jgi:hypothetical protein
MSFFYLQKFRQADPNSFFTLKEILKMSPPNIVVLQLSPEESQEKYEKVMRHPKFEELMQKFDYYLESKDAKAIQEMKEFDLENLEKLYLIRYCRKKKCTVVYGQRDN